MDRGAVAFGLWLSLAVGGCATVLGLDDGEPLDGSAPPTDAPADSNGSDGTVSLDGGVNGCGAGQKSCSSACVAVSDPSYGCGDTTCTPCPSNNVDPKSRACNGGTCAFTCQVGFAHCNATSSGCETPLGTNDNCSGCGNACVPPKPYCGADAGARFCSATCDPPNTNCPGGCWDLSSDLKHCGATCGTAVACPPPPLNADMHCTTAGCTPTCQAPFSNCADPISNGCIYNTSSDYQHCGSGCVDCKASPPPHMHSDLTCASGNCGYVCDNGYNNCDPFAGCECFGTCSGPLCVPYDAGGTDSGCLAGGSSCSVGPPCCVGGCVAPGICCFTTGQFAPSGASQCCAGCGPAPPLIGDAGVGDASAGCTCK